MKSKLKTIQNVYEITERVSVLASEHWLMLSKAWGIKRASMW